MSVILQVKSIQHLVSLHDWQPSPALHVGGENQSDRGMKN